MSVKTFEDVPLVPTVQVSQEVGLSVSFSCFFTSFHISCAPFPCWCVILSDQLHLFGSLKDNQTDSGMVLASEELKTLEDRAKQTGPETLPFRYGSCSLSDVLSFSDVDVCAHWNHEERC